MSQLRRYRAHNLTGEILLDSGANHRAQVILSTDKFNEIHGLTNVVAVERTSLRGLGDQPISGTLLSMDPFDLVVFSNVSGEVLATIEISLVATVDPAILPRAARDGTLPPRKYSLNYTVFKRI